MTLTQQIQKPEVRIRQRKGEVYYETSIEKSVSGGWIPFIVEHGITQEEADTKAFRSLLSPYKEMNIYQKIRIRTRWAISQLENDQRMKEPNVDIKSIVIAVGTILILIGVILWIL